MAGACLPAAFPGEEALTWMLAYLGIVFCVTTFLKQLPFCSIFFFSILRCSGGESWAHPHLIISRLTVISDGCVPNNLLSLKFKHVLRFCLDLVPFRLSLPRTWWVLHTYRPRYFFCVLCHSFSITEFHFNPHSWMEFLLSNFHACLPFGACIFVLSSVFWSCTWPLLLHTWFDFLHRQFNSPSPPKRTYIYHCFPAFFQSPFVHLYSHITLYPNSSFFFLNFILSSSWCLYVFISRAIYSNLRLNKTYWVAY